MCWNLKRISMRTIKPLILIFFSLYLLSYSFAQTNADSLQITNEVYTTFWGLKNTKQYPIDTDFEVKFKNDKFLVIENFYNKENGERIPIMDIYNIFFVKHNGNYYYQMGVYKEKSKERVFVKLDLVGDYCVFVLAHSDFELNSTKSFKETPIIPHDNVAAALLYPSYLLAPNLLANMIKNFKHSQDFNSVHEPYFINDYNERVNLYYIDTKKSTNYKRLNYNKFKKIFSKETELHQKMKNNELNVKEIIELFRKK
jgi:hypothetical protein